MDIEEVSRRYGVPRKFLKEYKLWNLPGLQTGSSQFDDKDITNISLAVTLLDIGFSISDVKKYLEYIYDGDPDGRLRLAMLESLRHKTMKAIHDAQLRLDKLDYLRYSMRKFKEGKNENNSYRKQPT